MLSGSLADTDVVGFHRGEAKSCFVVLHFVDGELAAKDWELMETPMEEDNTEVVSALVSQFYAPRNQFPKQILLPCEIEDEVPLTRMFSESAGRRVNLVTPQRGAKMDLIRLAHTNAVEEVERATTRQERTNKLLEALGKLLGLEEVPRRMEAYDISNTGADDIVASMTVFVDGKPRKRDYKHFKIKDLTGPDDYASMAQVIKRRFTHYINGDDNWNEKPDLLLIDGGSVHAKTAQDALEALGMLAKESPVCRYIHVQAAESASMPALWVW